jgi:hypothetical protein
VKVRLMGTEQECAAAAARLAADPGFTVLEQSAPYPNRAPSELVRVYLEVHVAPVAAGAEGGRQ